MQETEINKNLDHNLLSFPGYNIETENNTAVSRVAAYISNKINNIRRVDLEGIDSNLLILNPKGEDECRIINVYRSFAPQHNIGQREKFNPLMYGLVLWNNFHKVDTENNV